MLKVFFLTILLLVFTHQQYPSCEAVANCQACDHDHTADPEVQFTCHTCAGWYQVSPENFLCYISVRLVVVTILGAFIFFGVLICTIVKCNQYCKTKHRRPTNVENYDYNYQPSEQELNSLTWHVRAEGKLDDTNACHYCEEKGGIMTLDCGCIQSFHGDCAVWELKDNNTCGVCKRKVSKARIHCIKCLSKFVECDPKLYIEFKKNHNRICPSCTAPQ